MLVYALSYRSLPTYSGVYIFLDGSNNVLYVGKAKNLKNRVSSYFTTKNLGTKTKNLVSQIKKIKTIEVNSEIEAFLLEERLIKKYTPKYNLKLTDGKTYPSIKITVSDKYPKIFMVRKQENDKSIYFGPFTSATALRTVLKIIRRIFPYQSVLNHGNKICLYNHLGLCPCPYITNDKNYKYNISHIIDFLNGNTKKVIKDLENERNNFTKNEEYEMAGKTQSKIDSINLITSAFYKPFEYELNPNLRSDVLKSELDDLRKILIENNVYVKDLIRIECYDISNTSGTNATGSMVVLIDGEIDKSSYRRFKIKNDYKNKPNDFAMLQEIIERRLKNKNWKYPSLIVVDGGKGQVSAVKNVLRVNNVNIPLIGLAKKYETIITSDLKEVTLSKNSKSLLLLIKIRDEAHRFAITYHKKLRSKFIFSQ